MSDTWRAIAPTVNSASLRRAQLAFAAIWAGEWAVMVTLGVVAFRAGGTAAVGAVTALRMLRGCGPSMTVRAAATSPLRVAILCRARFLTAVAGCTAGSAAAEDAVAPRLRVLDHMPAPAAVAPR